MHPRIEQSCFAIGGILIGVVGMFTLHALFDTHPSLENCDDFELLNPYIRCEPDDNVLSKKEFTNFKGKLEERIYALIGQKKITHASVYLRDLQFGPWMGIDEEETYSAGSLLKVSIMMTLLRQEELHPGTLQRTIPITPEYSARFSQEFSPLRHVETGKSYTIDELLTYMIVYSDNDATIALSAYVNSNATDGSPILRTLEELGLIGQFSTDDSLTVKQTASMFRTLFNSSYLRKDLSQKALDLLSRTTFLDGIRMGVPTSIVVAHKFGERELDDDTKQLHDCGIVYYPNNPYLLCVMTHGKDIHALSSVIASISRMTYEEISSRNVTTSD